MGKLFVVGIGPGGRAHMTERAIEVIRMADVIVSYTPYLNYIEDLVEGKDLFHNGMRGEIERCKKAVEFAEEGKNVAVISTGDAGVYGMAGPVYELSEGKEVTIEVVPGVSSAMCAASELGAPLMHDFAVISLSDLLTDYELIKKRVRLAAEGDFVIAFYNPKSKTRVHYLEEMISIISEYRSLNTPVGIVKNSGRSGTVLRVATLSEMDYEDIDMLTIVIVGNSATFIQDGKIITPRGHGKKII